MKRTYLAVLLCSSAFSQTPAAKPAFEVASIKPGLSGNITPAQFQSAIQSGRFRSLIDNARVDLGSISLEALIEMAYRIPQDRLTGPGWMGEQRFDILAKLPEGATKDQVPEMLQTLLEERFKLVVHHDQKVVPVYALEVGKDGPKFHESTAEDSAYAACNGGFHKICRKMSMEDLAAHLTFISQRMASMPGVLEWGIDRPVVDMTGLKGVYDFTMDYGRGVAGGGGRGGPGAAAPPPTDGTPRSVIEAVKDLGLKLEPIKHTFDNLVVDHVERVPTEN
jgi:uncharacterized protein (TIGR03435 family)